MFVDSLVFNRHEQLVDEWLVAAKDPRNMTKLVELVRTYRPGKSPPKRLHVPIRGSYNVNWRLDFEDGLSVMIHVPIPHVNAFPDEKIRAEVATMKLIREQTTIPVPEVYGWGTTAENPSMHGPFIVMEYIHHTSMLEHVIKEQMKSTDSDDPQNKVLLKAYRQMANIMLQLSTIQGDAIGYPSLPEAPICLASSLTNPPISSQTTQEMPSRISRVRHRPVSNSMNELVGIGGLPLTMLPPVNKTYATSREYYQTLADAHLAHLVFQKNDAVLSPPDCREKYIARQLFRRLAKEGRLTGDAEDHDRTSSEQEKEVFKLWCDDMRPTSVLLDDNHDVVGVIDWEMSYFAPASFHENPPWWLMLEKPGFYDKGLTTWLRDYEQCLPLFLKAVAMEEAELDGSSRQKAPGAMGQTTQNRSPSRPLSERMKRNWDNGRFFVDYCARRHYEFDPIYWLCVDQKFFGKEKKIAKLLKKGGYQGRRHLLSEKERAQMESFVAWKLEDRDDDKIVEWDEKDAQTVLEACLAGTLGDIDIPRPRQIPWTFVDRPPTPEGYDVAPAGPVKSVTCWIGLAATGGDASEAGAT